MPSAEEPEIYCEIKSHDLASLYKLRGESYFDAWWTGIDRQNRIQYLNLGHLSEIDQRNEVIKLLIGNYHIQKYWLQSFANSSKRVLVGFYDVIGPWGTSNEFRLNTIVEIDIQDIERYLSTTVCNFLTFH